MVPLLAAILVAQAATGGLSEAERKGVADSLFVGNLQMEDLLYERKLFLDPNRLPLIDQALDDPMASADRLLGLHQTGLGSASAALRAANALLAGGTSPAGTNSPNPAGAATPETGPTLPAPVRELATRLATEIATARQEVIRAYSGLSDKEARALFESLPRWATEEESIKFDFVNLPLLKEEEILRLVAKVDLTAIRRAAIRIYDAIQKEKEALKRLRTSAPFTGLWRGRLAGIQVEIGGVGRDVHESRDAALCIDLGGDDTYRGRYGAGTMNVGVMIDVTGDDEYLMTDLALGAGLMGVGLAMDWGGNDVIRSRSLSLGAGLAGVGIYEDDEGYDQYRSVALAQGFGQYGIGILYDREGKDLYTASLFAQGSARTRGVGWLIDKSGDDTYRCGGLILNSPLFSDVHYSNGQGYGSGYRKDSGGLSGGIGLMTDGGGDDAYIAETYAQAASYWFSIGSLYDGGGHDTYTAHHYSQASAMHATSAYLFDLAGDDAYVAKVGASHAIGHDYGVAFLLDRKGNDLYGGQDSRPGIGNAGGLGMFVDSAGQDRYFGPPGVANPARSGGSLGVFVDLGGEDVYAAGLADRGASAREAWSVALDADTSSILQPADPAAQARPGTTPFPGDAEMEFLYKSATQWGVGDAQAKVARAIFQLQEIGLPALKWMVDKKLKTSDRLQNRAFVGVISVLGVEGRLLLAPKCASDDLEEARNALRICTDLRVQEAAPYVAKALERTELARIAAPAVGATMAREAIPALNALAAGNDRMLVTSALTSLAALGDESTIATGQALMGATDLQIRKAAQGLVTKFPARARVIAKAEMDTNDERRIRIGIELMSKVALEEDLKQIAFRLRDPRVGVKISAMTALNGRVPLEFRSDLAALMSDPNPTVRAVASRIDPGR